MIKNQKNKGFPLLNQRQTEKKMKCYCLNCEKETEMIVKTINITSEESKVEGKCELCMGYLCRILAKDVKESIVE